MNDEQAKKEYYESQGLQVADIGSVALLRKEVNKKLISKGYKKLKGYKSRKQLLAILHTK